MKSVDLNFATTPFRNTTPYVLGYGLGILVLGAFTLYNGWSYSAYSQSRAELEAERLGKKTKIDALYQDAARLQGLIRQKNIDAMNSRASFTNSLLVKRRFSWTDLLNSLEEVQPYQVRLLSLLPRIQDKGIIIEARAVAKDLKDFSNFQQNLQSHPKFRRVYPNGFTRNNEAGEYIFNISFNYFPDGAPVDVQGLTPDEIIEAPGGGSSSPAPPEEAEGGPDGTSGSGAPPASRARKTPARPGAPSAAARPPAPGPGAAPPGSPMAQNPAKSLAPRIPGADPNTNPPSPDPRASGNSAPSMGGPNPYAAAATAPGAAPGVPIDPNAPKKARWQGRGLPPGGKRPEQNAPRPTNTIPAAVPRPPDPDPDDEEPAPDEDGTEDTP